MSMRSLYPIQSEQETAHRPEGRGKVALDSDEEWSERATGPSARGLVFV